MTTPTAELIARLRSIDSIRRDSTPLSVAVDLCHEAADALAAADAENERLKLCRDELREATNAIQDPAVNLVITLPQAIERLVARVAELERDAAGLAKAIERGGHCLMEMMKCYERRVRSDCKSQAEIDQQPWRCAEYIAAEQYIRTMFAARSAPNE